MLKRQTQRELQNARVACTGDPHELHAVLAGVRSAEIRAVERIERLKTKRRRQPFLQLEALRKAKVDTGETGRSEGVPAQSTEGAKRVRRERVFVEVLIDPVALRTAIAQNGVADNVGALPAGPGSRVVNAATDGEGKAGLQADDRIQIPTANDHPGKPAFRLKWQFPETGKVHHVPLIEV